jgi:hypothetical protein
MATDSSSDSSRASVSKTEFSPNYNPNSIGALDPEEQKEIADYNPNAPLELEAQYQLAQDEEKPLPPPVSERGIPRTVTMLLATGAAVLFAVGVWNVVKPREGVKQIAQRTPKETKEPLIQDEKPELLAKLAYLDQQKLLAEKAAKNRKTQTRTVTQTIKSSPNCAFSENSASSRYPERCAATYSSTRTPTRTPNSSADSNSTRTHTAKNTLKNTRAPTSPHTQTVNTPTFNSNSNIRKNRPV